jgi:predicted acetyltransferase
MSSNAGWEIGNVEESELDSMLGLMCESFALPLEAARRIFYADPYFDLTNKQVLRIRDRIVSCLTIVETSCWIGAGIVKTAGIAGVATRQSERRQGYASRLLLKTLFTLRQRGYALAALFPYEFDFYRKFGWEMAGCGHRVEILSSHLPAYHDDHRVRTAVIEDIPALERLYNTLESGNALRCLRDAKRWSYLLTYISHCLVYVSERGTVEGYLLYDLQRDRKRDTPQEHLQEVEERIDSRLRVLEIESETPEAKRGLIGHLARQSQADRIEYLSDGHGVMQSGLLHPVLKPDIDRLAHVEIVPSVMLRVVDLAKAAESLLPEWNGFQGTLTLKMTDSLLPAGSMIVCIEGDEENGVRVCEIADETLLPKSSLLVEGDVLAWSQVIVGHVGAAEAYALGRLQSSSQQAIDLAARLFPTRSPFLPVPDHF